MKVKSIKKVHFSAMLDDIPQPVSFSISRTGNIT